MKSREPPHYLFIVLLRFLDCTYIIGISRYSSQLFHLCSSGALIAHNSHDHVYKMTAELVPLNSNIFENIRIKDSIT